MESSESDVNLNISSTAATNWTVSDGSHDNSVTIETSLSQIDDHADDDNDQSPTVDSASKSPLILRPPLPDPTPCEITLTFAQKHEVRHVYVRSTARVYEIYYTPELQGDSEYLCTVRCGIAVRDEEVMRVTHVDEAILAHQKGSMIEPMEEKVRKGGEVTTNEDDWVEVKVPGNKSCSFSYPQTASQDLYEATAEMTDVNPCMSLTLRLLSLQNKGCVCVEEIYVLADPVDAASLDNQVAPVENYAGSSLMAMLVPAFHQLTRTKAINPAQEKYDDDVGKKKLEETGSETIDPITVINKNQQELKFQQAVDPTAKPVLQEVKFQEAVETTVKQVQLQDSLKVSDTESRSDLTGCQIKGVLDQLVSRVDRIEDLFLRFEESMLKPIKSIDERLQQVEQQLEVLAKKTEKSGLISCTRISAPEFSCSESETNSFYNSGSRDADNTACETNKKDSESEMLFVPSDDTSVPVGNTTLHPSLVVTAPEFSYDEEENHSAEPANESHQDIKKRAVSIDDALGNYLAQFLPSMSVQSQKCSEALEVKAPEFPHEEENVDDKTASPRVCSEIATSLCTSVGDSDGPEPMRSSCLYLSHISGDEDVRSPNEMNLSNIGEGVDESWQLDEHVECDFQDNSVDHEAIAVTNDLARNDDGLLAEEVSNGMSNISSVEEIGSLKQFSGNETDVDSVVTVVLSELGTSTEVVEEGSKEDVLHNVVEICAAPHVDYESPILDVQFVHKENSNAKSPLEALLAGAHDPVLAVSSVEEGNNDSAFDIQSDLIPLDWGGMDTAIDAPLSVDMDYYSLRDAPVEIARSSNQGISAESLI